jgi:hypothetical protein
VFCLVLQLRLSVIVQGLITLRKKEFFWFSPLFRISLLSELIPCVRDALCSDRICFWVYSFGRRARDQKRGSLAVFCSRSISCAKPSCLLLILFCGLILPPPLGLLAARTGARAHRISSLPAVFPFNRSDFSAAARWVRFQLQSFISR